MYKKMIIMLVTVALNLTIQGFNINALTASAVPLDHYHIVITYTKPHKKYIGHKYSNWNTIYSAKKKTKSTFSKSVTWANSLTGNVSLSKGKLTALLGFNVTRSDTVTINVPFSFNGKYRQKVQYRKRYRKYKITRIEYLKIVGSSTQKKHLRSCLKSLK
ncbi:hypothetical protein FEZ39_13170 [Lentilactobacillus parabuchneri]|uniref:DUF5626 domain-containing protein n=1 Tax=Lentilactobacillus parabuchneri TaxID=152331 RepID=A0A1X1FAS2_9LACO|nr:hypothetical protein [Lentilactobacillus parabuchneri]ORN24044.1 hypothetical protein FAM23169_02724 [Lentilactobacillus parabuchneri]TLQ27517.1 hypothetical protein FEZ39_13170 [Lentilactobacillus parabuchneri]